jgi:hypothetical protein
LASFLAPQADSNTAAAISDADNTLIILCFLEGRWLDSYCLSVL